MDTSPIRFFRITFRTSEGRTYWRYIKCKTPERIRTPQDWADSLEGMQKRLAQLLLEGRLYRFSVIRVENIDDRVRDSMRRWSDIEPLASGEAA